MFGASKIGDYSGVPLGLSLRILPGCVDRVPHEQGVCLELLLCQSLAMVGSSPCMSRYSVQTGGKCHDASHR